jgi:hypothetical protein
MTTKKSKPHNNSAINKNQAESHQRLSYEITDEPMFDNNNYRNLPESIQDELDNIHAQLTPAKLSAKNSTTISRLEELVKQYPDVPVISNYLAAAYSTINSPKFDTCVQENYQKHPDYLFARIHYADQCLERDELDKIKEIFKEGFDLKLLYPQRTRFHLSEFIGFGTFLCRYFMETGEQERAEMILHALEEIAPDHPAVKQASFTVESNTLMNLLQKMVSTKPNPRKRAAAKKKSSNFKA